MKCSAEGLQFIVIASQLCGKNKQLIVVCSNNHVHDKLHNSAASIMSLSHSP